MSADRWHRANQALIESGQWGSLDRLRQNPHPAAVEFVAATDARATALSELEAAHIAHREAAANAALVIRHYPNDRAALTQARARLSQTAEEIDNAIRAARIAKENAK